MTKKRLEAYRSETREIEELKSKLKALSLENYTGNDVILDYRSGFPIPRAVMGTDVDAYQARKERLRAEISRLEQRCLETEQWIQDIPDSVTRRIFRLYFEEGQGQQAIAKRLHVDRSYVSKKINNYIKCE
jgi:DNA-directed RNA polymerase specialized sigma subunit